MQFIDKIKKLFSSFKRKEEKVKKVKVKDYSVYTLTISDLEKYIAKRTLNKELREDYNKNEAKFLKTIEEKLAIERLSSVIHFSREIDNTLFKYLKENQVYNLLDLIQFSLPKILSIPGIDLETYEKIKTNISDLIKFHFKTIKTKKRPEKPVKKEKIKKIEKAKEKKEPKVTTEIIEPVKEEIKEEAKKRQIPKLEGNISKEESFYKVKAAFETNLIEKVLAEDIKEYSILRELYIYMNLDNTCIEDILSPKTDTERDVKDFLSEKNINSGLELLQSSWSELNKGDASRTGINIVKNKIFRYVFGHLADGYDLNKAYNLLNLNLTKSHKTEAELKEALENTKLRDMTLNIDEKILDQLFIDDKRTLNELINYNWNRVTLNTNLEDGEILKAKLNIIDELNNYNIYIWDETKYKKLLKDFEENISQIPEETEKEQEIIEATNRWIEARSAEIPEASEIIEELDTAEDTEEIISPMSLDSQIGFIFKEKIHVPFNTGEEGLNRLRNYLKEDYNNQNEYTDDDLIYVIEKNPNILKIKPGIYISKTKAEINEADKDAVLHILNGEYLNEDTIYPIDLYQSLNTYTVTNFISHHQLFDYIIKNLEGFTKSEDNRTIIRVDVIEQRKDRREARYNIFSDMAEKTDGLVYIKDLRALGWTDRDFNSLLRNNENLLKYGTSKIIDSDLALNEDLIKSIKEIIDSSLEKGYSSTNKIYTEMVFDENAYNFINKYDIEEPRELANLIKYIDPNIVGLSSLIYRRDSNLQDFGDIIKYEFKDSFTRSDYFNLKEELAYGDNMARKILDELVDTKEYIQVDRENYIRGANFFINDEVKEEVEKLAKSQLELEGYIRPNLIARELDLLGFEIKEGLYWNQYTVSAILDELNYKRLKRHNMSYLYEILIYIDGNSILEEIDELAYELVKYRYNGEYLEPDIYDFLAEMGIYELESMEEDKKLENDLTYREMFTVDMAKRVEINEDIKEI